MTDQSVDIVLHGGCIVSADPQFSQPEALWIHAGRIAAVGTRAAVRAVCGAAPWLDLDGRSVTPGFIDTHGHIALFGLDELKVQLDGAFSCATIVERIAAAARGAAPGAWLITTPIGTPPYYLDFEDIRAAGELPHRDLLDRAAPDNPVYITAPTNRVPNSALLNSRALALAGIEAGMDTDAPIEIVLDSAGNMSGELRGAMQPLYNPHAFYARIAAVIPTPDYADVVEGIRRLAPVFAAGGTTSLLEAHLTHPRELAAYRALLESGELPLRVCFTFEIESDASAASIAAMLDTVRFAAGAGFGNDQLRVVGISAGLDGPYWHGAACHDQPYPGPFGESVAPGTLMPAATYREIVRQAIAHDFRLYTECAGTGAMDIALGELAAAHALTPIDQRRFVIEHCEFPRAEHIETCAALGIIPTTSTNFIWGKGTEVYLERLGAARAEQAIPLRDWLDAGVPVCQSTDWGPRNAMFTLWQSLVRHAGRTGLALGESQHITREEALRIFTINGAHALGMADSIGSLEVGKRADIAILSDDILTCPTAAIREIDVHATLRDGIVIHRQRGAPLGAL